MVLSPSLSRNLYFCLLVLVNDLLFCVFCFLSFILISLLFYSICLHFGSLDLFSIKIESLKIPRNRFTGALWGKLYGAPLTRQAKCFTLRAGFNHAIWHIGHIRAARKQSYSTKIHSHTILQHYCAYSWS